MNIKEEISKYLPNQLKNLVNESIDSTKGDYSVACFSLAKELKKSPIVIAEEIANNIKNSVLFEKVEAVSGYVNFFLNKQLTIKNIIEEFNTYGVNLFKSKEGKNKTICIDYASVNLAKYMHIGHLCTTIIGESLARIYENCGYKVIRMNYVGDYGTPFGKMIVGYKLWGNKKDVETRGIDAIQSYYVEFCKHEDEEQYMQMARDCFVKIEKKDPEIMQIYNWFIDISIKETERLCSLLGVKFDDWRGESYYSEKMQPIIDELKNSQLLKIGENGAKIVNLGDLGICVILKSDGSSLYVTRDLSAACDRYNEYKFDKCLYVTDVAQKLHFAQFFKILEMLNKPFAKNLQHIYYGRLSLPDGKISSRLGKQALLKDIIEEAINKARTIIKDRNLKNGEDVAKKIGIGATIFSVLKKDKTKDSVFDLNNALNFEGETSPYMQYTYARCASILRKVKIDKNATIDYSFLNNNETFEIVKLINDFGTTIKSALENNEPSIISKKIMELCGLLNVFYHKQKVICDNEVETQTKLQIINMVKETIKFGLNLICIDTVEEM